MRLFDHELSGNCYKVRLLLHMLGRTYERHAINFHPGREHKAAWFLERHNPLGQLPVLEDDGVSIRDAQAILVYLASRYDADGRWYPDDALVRARIQAWFAAADELTRTAGAARLHEVLPHGVLDYPCDLAACRTGARAVLRLLDDHLAERHGLGLRWLASSAAPTIADIACFPYAALAPEGGVRLDEFPALRAWIADVRALPGFIGMGGIMAPAVSAAA